MTKWKKFNKEYFINSANIYKTGRKGKELGRMVADDYQEWEITLRGEIYSIYIRYRMRYITIRAYLRYYMPYFFGHPSGTDCIYELKGKAIKTTIIK